MQYDAPKAFISGVGEGLQGMIGIRREAIRVGAAAGSPRGRIPRGLIYDRARSAHAE